MPEYSRDMSGDDDRMDQDHVAVFETLLNEASTTERGLKVSDLDTMSIVIMIRLRAMFTADELHQRGHVLIAQMEEWLTEPGAMRDENNNPTDPVLVENFENREDMMAMMRETREGVTDDDLSALLDEEQDV